MERFRSINQEAIVNKIPRKKAPVVASLFLAASAVMVSAQTEAKTPWVYEPLPQEDFHTLIVYEARTDNLTVSIPPPVPADFENSVPEPTPKVDWKVDPEISWYGPNFYGKRTACGLELTTELKGVASRDLPCGTPVTFNWEGMTLTFPVVDRGPYVEGRIFDLTGGACMAFQNAEHPKGHCLTGPINYVIGNQFKTSN